MKVERTTDTCIVYADGSCLGNPGRGGWAFSGVIAGKPVEASGSDRATTNNRMELIAATEALKALPEDAVGVLKTDSQYVVKGLNEWRAGWEAKAFKKVLNVELWHALYAIRDKRPGIRIGWVKGHAKDAGNNRVDGLALAAAKAA